MFQLYIAACPDSPLGYNNLGSVQGDMGKPAIAVETLRSAICRMPGESILWNSLATVLAEEGRAEESLVFYREAIRLDPDFARLYHNLGYAYSHLGRLSEALEAYDSAFDHVVDPAERIESQPLARICMIGMGTRRRDFANTKSATPALPRLCSPYDQSASLARRTVGRQTYPRRRRTRARRRIHVSQTTLPDIAACGGARMESYRSPSTAPG